MIIGAFCPCEAVGVHTAAQAGGRNAQESGENEPRGIAAMASAASLIVGWGVSSQARLPGPW